MQAEDVKPYDEASPKGQQVEAMFDSIAPAYDFMNTAMTFGMHRRWLRKALDKVATTASQPYTGIIDLATGTGDVAFNLATRYPEASILGVDLSAGMLAVARTKLSSADIPAVSRKRIKFEQGDCLDLQYPEESFDLLTIAYGVRNFENLEKGFKEFYRVLCPGGKCMILELSVPENSVIRLGYNLYTRTLIPLIGRLISKDRRAYSYLPESIAAMPPRMRITEMLKEAGFSKVEFKSLTLGVVTYYIAEK